MEKKRLKENKEIYEKQLELVKEVIRIEFSDLAANIIKQLEQIKDVKFDKDIVLRTHIIKINVSVKESLILDENR